MKPCKDCLVEGVTTIRKPALDAHGDQVPGGRCVTHWREEKKRRRSNAHERMAARVYNLPPGAYEALYEAQGGTCWVCERATGAAKALAIDHDHESGYIRGLLCGPDNRDVIGRLGPRALIRAAEYLVNPPAFAVIGKVKVPE